MTKNIALPLLCLFVGGVAGYGLRSMSDSGETNPVSSVSAAAKGRSSVGSDSKASGSTSQVEAASAKESLSDLMNELLVDYDVKSAKKAAAKLSVAELQSALALVAAMPKSMYRDALRTQLYSAWAAIDPNAAWKAALTDPLDKNKGTLLGAVAGTVAKTNPSAAIDLALSLGMGGRRSTVLSAVFSEWGKTDVAAAIAYSNAHPDLSVESFSFSLALNQLAEKEPLKAANLALTFKDESRRGFALTSLMGAWVESDPAAALNWAQALSNPKLRQDAIAATVGAWAKSDPAAALAYVQAIQNAETRTEAFKNAWTDWFKNSPKEAAAYLGSTKDEKLLQSVRFYFSILSEGFSPKERASLLAQIPEGKIKEDISNTMTDSQIRKGQYNQALDMLNAMPDSAGRDRNVVKLGQEWGKTDLKAAAAWLKIQPDSTDRDLATAGYVGALARTDPTSAIKWAEAIPDQKVRSGAMDNIAVGWLKSDPVRAEAWMATVPSFTPSKRKMITSYANMGTDSIMVSVQVGERR